MGTEEFWEFALARYARPGVAQCCVALQDEHGANVMLLLYCAWRAQGGDCVRGAALRQAIARLEPLDPHLVRPLRAARRAIRRAADALGSPALGVGADRLMQAELAAERRQARLLADGASSLPAGPARSDQSETVVSICYPESAVKGMVLEGTPEQKAEKLLAILHEKSLL